MNARPPDHKTARPQDPLPRLAAILGQPPDLWIAHRVTGDGSHVVIISTGQKYVITPAMLEAGLTLTGDRID